MKRTMVRYGAGRAQIAELWLPPGCDRPPVLALVHGGFWRQVYTKRLMHALAKVAVDCGWAAYNIEYRRVGPGGSGGWPATFDDVSDAIDGLDAHGAVRDGGVVTCGHSAGGHLALWLAGPRATTSRPPQPHRVRVRAVISLAGIPDLVAAHRLDLGAGAVSALMGGSPRELPERYQLGSPAELLPLGVPQFLLHGQRDRTVPATLSEAHVSRARQSGDDAEYIPVPEAGHLDMIRRRGAPAAQMAALLERLWPEA